MALAIRGLRTRAKPIAVTEADELDAFYRDALPRVYGYFLRRCGRDAATAEELTQETFLAAVRRLKHGDKVDEPIPWIFAIARHKLVDHIRAASARRRVSADWDDDLLATFDSEPAAPTESWTQEAVERVLPRLPEAQRTAVVLRYMDDLAVPEVAQVLGRSVHATESLLARGRANLRRLLTDELEGRHD